MYMLCKSLSSLKWTVITLILFFSILPVDCGPASAQGWQLVKVRLDVPEKFKKGVFNVERYLNVPEGFAVSVFAAGLDSPRLMAFDRQGRLFVSLPSEGQVVVLPDEDGTGSRTDKLSLQGGLHALMGLRSQEMN